MASGDMINLKETISRQLDVPYGSINIDDLLQKLANYISLYKPCVNKKHILQKLREHFATERFCEFHEIITGILK